jgi:hypothetical protein|tara:strand:- start:565 stop:912 length:348 start_codon:yes stop_codon:yes gene_type:complete
MYYSRRKNKYGAQKTTVDGITFDSKWESQRWGELRAMERGGYVKDLERQVKYEIIVNDQKICRYVADFRYKKVDDDGTEETVVEDAKGFETPDFKLKKKLMKAVHGIELFLSRKS